VSTQLSDRARISLDRSKHLARPERFELPTTWFEARYSIQLSYGRETLYLPSLAQRRRLQSSPAPPSVAGRSLSRVPVLPRNWRVLRGIAGANRHYGCSRPPRLAQLSYRRVCAQSLTSTEAVRLVCSRYLWRSSAFSSSCCEYRFHSAASASLAFHIVKWQVFAPAGIVESNRTSQPLRRACSRAASIMPRTK
jgi:hypothetical protein